MMIDEKILISATNYQPILALDIFQGFISQKEV
jgi:hypothetical protein